MKYLLALATALTLLFTAASAHAATPSISGHVVDSNDADVVGYCVSWTSYSGSGSLTSAPFKTDSDGNFFMDGPRPTDHDGLEPGDYTVQFFNCNDGTNPDLIPEYWDDAPSISEATHFQIAAGEARSGIDAELEIGASIAGTIRGPGGAAAPFGCATLDPVDPDRGGSGYGTGGTGEYIFRLLPAGDYQLFFSDCDHDRGLLSEWWDDKPDKASATVITLAAGQHLTGIDPELAPGGRIEGIARDRTGAPVKACVTAYDAAGNEVGTDGGDYDTGAYSITSLPTGDYRLLFTDCAGEAQAPDEYWNNKSTLASADPIHVTAPDSTTADIQLGGDSSISGIVRGPGTVPLAGACVTAYDGTGTEVTDTTTGATGTYSLPGIDPGDYRLYFEDCATGTLLSEYYDDKATLAAATPVTAVGGANTGGINATLAAPAPPPPPDTTACDNAQAKLKQAKKKLAKAKAKLKKAKQADKPKRTIKAKKKKVGKAKKKVKSARVAVADSCEQIT